MTVTTITHGKSGATCQVHSLGATVISFVPAGKTENVLFVSKQAVLDGSKAIRGGIPICFPIFGPPKAPSTMPQHGFARVSEWTLVQTEDHEQAATATFSLDLAQVTQGRGEHNPWTAEQAALDGTNCRLTYEIRLEAQRLTTTLLVDNTGTASFDFQTLLHTYYHVHQGAALKGEVTQVSGLGGYAITDKVSGDSGHVQSYDEPIVVDGEVDRVYIHPDEHPVVNANLILGEKTHVIHMEAAGQVDGNVVPVSCVVWNPHAAKAAAMGDFGDEEYHDMICLEPGLIGHQPVLDPGKQARLTQIIVVQ